MPGLTVTEKEHWKDRIGKRIDRRIETISAAEPNLLVRVEREARQRAQRSLGLAGLQAELDQIEQQKEALVVRERLAERTMLAKVRGVPVESLEEYCGRHIGEVEQAVKRRQAVHEEELLAENPIGQTILELRREKDNLLDTVWLACSSAQIKVLWHKVAELLGDDQTRLQIEALAIVPIREE